MFKWILFLLLSIHSVVAAMPPTMDISEVKPGMSGTAYTVIDPSGKILPFNVSIVGTIESGRGAIPYIMARASGGVINETKGVLQGMSGSPVYIDGKLVGALSAGFKDTDSNTFLITPINVMLKIWDKPDTVVNNPYKLKQPAEELENSAEDDESEVVIIDDAEEIEDVEDNIQQNAQIIYNGFDLDFLKSSIGNFDYMITAAGEPSMKFDKNLYAGSPVGVCIVVGDFLVGSTGTVTVEDNKKILAFGHPFMHGGNVNYFMTEANVLGPVSGNNGMKIASVGPIIGRISQDRESGIGGVIGQFPAVVPVNVKVNNDNYNALIAYNEELVPKLGTAIAYSAFQKTLDSAANGTVKVRFDIKTNVVEDGTLSRENIFYNQSDVGQLAIAELLQALTLVSTNTTAESNIFGINVAMEFENKRRTAALVSATCDKNLVKPGEEVILKVKLQPYRSESFMLEIPYKIPVTTRPGTLTLDLYGGTLVPVQTAAANASPVITPSTKAPEQIYNEKIQQLLNANKNNEIIIKPAAMNLSEKELKNEIKRAKKLLKLGIKPQAAAPKKFATDYVIENAIQCKINVDKI